MEHTEEVKYQLNQLLEKEKERELLKADNELLKSKWEAQGLMIQKLHKECALLKETLKEIAEVGEINSYEHAILVAKETLESLGNK
ncbi:hypothetical protein [Neobacillus sp. DY30]|uniref:hypothetical protein n=1 Tax=Neobacillus sp. DY30 TaxID=3047871 RepID=UPI0024BF34B5|nr:hypothetical protein [Neobacillus sp. DY30]WHY01817.1 hypothetical protein QNH29_06210 [Neobacillus sp. DY30]